MHGKRVLFFFKFIVGGVLIAFGRLGEAGTRFTFCIDISYVKVSQRSSQCHDSIIFIQPANFKIIYCHPCLRLSVQPIELYTIFLLHNLNRF